MNVVNFPVCRNVKGRHWYGGRGFDTKQEVIDSMSDKDWRRIVQWNSRSQGKCLALLKRAAMSYTSVNPAHRLSRFSFSLKEQ